MFYKNVFFLFKESFLKPAQVVSKSFHENVTAFRRLDQCSTCSHVTSSSKAVFCIERGKRINIRGKATVAMLLHVREIFLSLPRGEFLKLRPLGYWFDSGVAYPNLFGPFFLLLPPFFFFKSVDSFPKKNKKKSIFRQQQIEIFVVVGKGEGCLFFMLEKVLVWWVFFGKN